MASILHLSEIQTPDNKKALNLQRLGDKPGYYLRRAVEQVYTDSLTFGTGWTLLPSNWAAIGGITPGSILEVFYHIPWRNDNAGWGGIYTELQVSVNGGPWQSLGGSGYEMVNVAGNILHYNNTLLLSPDMAADYSVQFRIYCRSYQGTCGVNNGNGHDLNSTSGTASGWYTDTSGVAPQPNNQHYTHLILKEFAPLK